MNGKGKGTARGDEIAVNICHGRFSKEPREILLYVAELLFRAGYNKYQPAPDIYAVRTGSDLKQYVLSLVMREGLSTLVTLYKRRDLGLHSEDTVVLGNLWQVEERLEQFREIIESLEQDGRQAVDYQRIEQVLTQCYCERLFTVIGCQLAREILGECGVETFRKLVKHPTQAFFEEYDGRTRKKYAKHAKQALKSVA